MNEITPRSTPITPAETEDFRSGLLDAIPSLRAFGISLIGTADKADDLVQETLVKAWAKQTSFVPGTNLKAWLFTILRNEFYTQMRKRGREVTDSEGVHASKLAGHPEQIGHLDMQDFRAALDKLPADQREAIILVGASGFPTKKRPKCAIARSAPSRAASAAPACACPNCSMSRATRPTGRTTFPCR